MFAEDVERSRSKLQRDGIQTIRAEFGVCIKRSPDLTHTCRLKSCIWWQKKYMNAYVYCKIHKLLQSGGFAWHKQQWKHPASLLYSWRSSQTRGIIEGDTSILCLSMFQWTCPEKKARLGGISQQGIHQCMVTFRELNYLRSEFSTFWCTFIVRYLILQCTKCIISTHNALQA